MGPPLSCPLEQCGANNLLYHPVIDWFGLEGIYKENLGQPLCHGQGHLALDQVAQSPVQPDFEHFQLMGQPQLFWAACASV